MKILFATERVTPRDYIDGLQGSHPSRSPSHLADPVGPSYEGGDMLPFKGQCEEELSLKRIFRVGKVIGQVRKMKRKSDGVHFALKVIYKDKIPPLHDAWKHEAKLLSELDHPHILKLEGVFETPRKLMLVMEYLSTDLHEALELRAKILEKQAIRAQEVGISLQTSDNSQSKQKIVPWKMQK
eukprot:g79761.t1